MNHCDSALAGPSDVAPPADPDPGPPRGPGFLASATQVLELARARWGSGRPEHGFTLDHRRLIAWYALFTAYAVALIIFSGGGADRVWGIWAAGGYALTIVPAMLASRFRGLAVPLFTALACALAAPSARTVRTWPGSASSSV